MATLSQTLAYTGRDEADVFLETRGTPGEKVFERNALVSGVY
jgi:hypothetical protein